MVRLKIDNIAVEAEEGTLLHKAARQAGIEIPVMCWYEGTEHFTSCLVCVVKERESGRLIPSCSVRVADGMDIVTDDSEVMEFRKRAIELLLSEHTGDCEAPCRVSCPAGMDIPLMNRLLAEGKFHEALAVVRRDIALPSVLGRICPAPCEGACRRRPIDGAVSICLLKRFAGDNYLSGDNHLSGDNSLPEENYLPGDNSLPGDDRVPDLYAAEGTQHAEEKEQYAAGGKQHAAEVKQYAEAKKQRRIAIAGAGPAGLSAAYYLRLRGYDCDIYDSSSTAGGAVRSSVADDILPKSVLDREIKIIEERGVRFCLSHTIGKSEFEKLQEEYDAVVIACSLGEEEIADWGLLFSGSGIKVDKRSYQTNIEKVFAIGSALRPTRLAVRSMGQGKEAAFSVEQLLNGEAVAGEPLLFNSRFGRLLAEEHDEYLKESFPARRSSPEAGTEAGFTAEEVMHEAARCLRCDCRGKEECLLRSYADNYGADQKRFAPAQRRMIRKIDHHDLVIYEPEKCIKCGRCVRITAIRKERLGLTFIGRGFDVEIGVPFNEELRSALTTTAEEVVRACPTGALEMKSSATSRLPGTGAAPAGLAAGGKSRDKGSKSSPFSALSTLLLVVSLLFNVTVSAQESGSWPIFRGDPELRGVSYARLPASPVLLWTYRAADGIKASPVVSKGIIITASVRGTVYALNLQGELLWEFESGNSIEAPALIHNTTVYIGNLDGTLFALDLQSGRELWYYKTGGQIMGSPNIHRSGSDLSLIVGSYDYFLHCVDALTGKLRWRYESDNFIHSTAAISGGMAVFGGCDGFLHMVEITSGRLKSKTDIATYIASSASTGNGYAYIGDYDGQFTGVSLNDNKVVWRFTNESSQLPFIGSPSLYRNYIIAGGRDRHVYCLNRYSGELIWKFNTGSRVDASPVIIGEKVLVVNMRGDFLILDFQTGKPSWSYELGSPVSANPALIDNRIIIAADDGRIYCFGG